MHPLRLRWIGLALLAATLALASLHPLSGVARSAPGGESGARSALRTLVQSGRHADLHWPSFSDVRPDLERLYRRLDWRTAWLEGGRPTPAASALLARLAAADSLGLDPADYDAEWLAARAASLAGDPAGAGAFEQARFDLALSIAAARFVDALERGRVDPVAADALFPAPGDKRELDAIVDSLRHAPAQEGILARHQPDLVHYRLLKQALARYRALARDTSFARPIDYPRDLKPGGTLRAAARLRRRLQAVGDLGMVRSPRPSADTLYSPELVLSVKRYQRRHGLKPDGVIWPNTAEALNGPFSGDTRKIALALERWRWIPLPFTAPPIIVNIPAYRLEAYRSLFDREDNILAMEVLVGSADRNATPVFTADMSYLIFRPYWEVPLDLMMDELGPRAAWDSERLERQGIVLVKRGSDGSKSLPLTPENLKRIGRDLRMRQLPGPQNVLGRVKFMFPNMHDVYLHDTQAGGLFGFARRDFSHGCIRVSEPESLAAYVLRNQPGWEPEQVLDAMAGPDNRRVNITTPVPVFVTYTTAAAFENGEVEFYGDIYGRDPKLVELLEKGYPYPRGKAAKRGR
ncbi:MAG: L,D-transpeptidase family protein [Candidatus Eisenbacteria bacterium]